MDNMRRDPILLQNAILIKHSEEKKIFIRIY